MDIKKGIEHFVWKFSKNKNMTLTDKNALNAIIDYYNRKEEQKMHDYQMFGKVFVVLYKSLLKHYNCTVFDKEPMRSFDSIMKKPLIQHVEELTEFMNSQELYTIFDLAEVGPMDHVHITHLEGIYKDNGVPEEVYRPKIDAIIKKRKETRKRFEQILEDHPDVKEMLYKGKNVWKVEDVKNAINGIISDLIMRYDNE